MAIQQGFRNFFSSVLAGNQIGFGEGVRASAVNRSDLFICGSVNTGCVYHSILYTRNLSPVGLNLSFVAVI